MRLQRLIFYVFGRMRYFHTYVSLTQTTNNHEWLYLTVMIPTTFILYFLVVYDKVGLQVPADKRPETWFYNFIVTSCEGEIRGSQSDDAVVSYDLDIRSSPLSNTFRTVSLIFLRHLALLLQPLFKHFFVLVE